MEPKRLDEVVTYRITVQDGLDEASFNAASPLRVSVAHFEDDVAVLTLHADQAGLIGLLRYLHQQGYLLVSVTCETFRRKTCLQT